jgi:hypothetical protein
MLKIVSNGLYQVGFGMNWTSSQLDPWLPLFWHYHVDATFVRASGEIPCLVVENWVALETGKSFTAMVWYQHGSLMYSYGAFPNEGGNAVSLGRFALPGEFNVTISADYGAKNMRINWNDHKFDVPLQIERIGTIPKPFTHFQITLAEPGTTYIKNLRVVLS